MLTRLNSLVLLGGIVLVGCGPVSLTTGSPGRNNVLRFVYVNANGDTPAFAKLAAGGATIRVAAVPEAAVSFASADPSVFEVTPAGEVTSHRAGTADLIALRNNIETDRIAVTVDDTASLTVQLTGGRGTVQRCVLYPRAADRVSVSRSNTLGVRLLGVLPFDIAATGAVTATQTQASPFGGGFEVTAGTVAGDGVVTIRSGTVSAAYQAHVVRAEEITSVEVLSTIRSGFSADGRKAVRVTTRALASDDVVSGASCAWTTPSTTTVGLDSDQQDGTWVTDFWTAEPSFTATCQLGSVSKAVNIVMSQVACGGFCN